MKLYVGQKVRWRPDGDIGKIIELTDNSIYIEWEKGGAQGKFYTYHKSLVGDELEIIDTNDDLFFECKIVN